jgi:protein-tyrosine phosphatase
MARHTGTIPGIPAATVADSAIVAGSATVAGSPIVVLCTANVCRSPMAAALLARRLRALGVTRPVLSAGTLASGYPPAPEAVAAMAAHGADISAHRSHIVAAADLAGAGLVLGMARAHIRHAAVLAPAVWPRAFTLKELVHRGAQAGPRNSAETLEQWLSGIHAGRQRTALLGEDHRDDVPDPTGGPPAAYRDTAALLSDLIGRLCELCWGHQGTGAEGR